MKLFIWRHNRKFHSYSMINEPVVHQELYTDAVIIVAAESKQRALEQLAREGKGWLPDELARLEPQMVDLDHEAVVFEDIRG
jgi:hypothetical protein